MDALAAYASDSSSDADETSKSPASAANKTKRPRVEPVLLPAPPLSTTDNSKMHYWPNDYLSAKQQQYSVSTSTQSLQPNPKLAEISKQLVLSGDDDIKCYADLLKQQHDFYNPHAVIITATNTTATTCKFQEWETIDVLVSKEEEARRRQQQA